MNREGGILSGALATLAVFSVGAAALTDRGPSNAQLNKDTLDALNGRGATTGEVIMTLEWQGSSALVQCRQGNPNGLLTSKDPNGMSSMGFACDTDQPTKGLTAKVNGEPFQTPEDTINPYETLNER